MKCWHFIALNLPGPPTFPRMPFNFTPENMSGHAAFGSFSSKAEKMMTARRTSANKGCHTSSRWPLPVLLVRWVCMTPRTLYWAALKWISAVYATDQNSICDAKYVWHVAQRRVSSNASQSQQHKMAFSFPQWWIAHNTPRTCHMPSTVLLPRSLSRPPLPGFCRHTYENRNV